LPEKKEDRYPCKFFLDGTCQHMNDPDKCSFPHRKETRKEARERRQREKQGGARSRSPPAPKGVCHHWLQGKCTYGDACQFKHERPDGQAKANGGK